MPENNEKESQESSNSLIKSDNESDDKSDLSSINQDLIKEIPPDVRKIIQASFSLIAQSRHPSDIPPEVLKQIEPAHITQFLNNMKDNDARTFDAYKIGLKHQYIMFVLIAVICMIFLYIFCSDDKDFLKEIINLGIVLLAGVGIGKGFFFKQKD